MKKNRLCSFVLGILLSLSIVTPVLADGIIIPDPPPPDVIDELPRPMTQLEIRYHRVSVKIKNQIASVRVDQVFYNPNEWEVEGTYVFPLPEDAAVKDFTLWVDGKPVKGEVLDAEKARDTYEAIVRQMKDPALLEYAGRGAVQASVFPIQPGEERRIELEYSQALTMKDGLVRFVYPLNTEKFSLEPLEDVAVTVEIEADSPLRAVYSPTHRVAVSRDGDKKAKAGYEESNVTPDKDFILFYSAGETQAFHLFTYRDPSDAVETDGYFMLMLAAPAQKEDQTIDKDIILVLDHSGSMEGEKFQQAQEALRYILDHLNSGDRFELISFSSGVEWFGGEMQPTSRAGDAARWMENLSAAGSTDINRALLEAASRANSQRPTYIIFLTDGLPTEGVTDREEIIRQFSQSAPENVRLFAFGVGYDVDTMLLDTLTRDHHGLSSYVTPGQPLDEILSSFYNGIRMPVMTNLKLDFDSISTYDIYPQPLPDLFAENQVIVVGRYRKGGNSDVTVEGEINGENRQLVYENQTFDMDSRESGDILEGLPRLWATRKVGYLLNQTRLGRLDKETIDQIVRLSIRYGIVTPYTSYLVTEPTALGASNQQQMAEEAYEQMKAMPTAAPSGMGAVDRAMQESAMTQADAPAAVPAPSDSNGENQTVKVVGSKTFVLQEGVWVDTTYDPDVMKPDQVEFLSDAYFELVNSSNVAADCLALGEKVIVVLDGTAYEIVEAGDETSFLPMAPKPMAMITQKASRQWTIADLIGPLLGGSGLLGLLAFLLWYK
jgi:Ca-activated chloride channel family protein